MSEHTPTPWFVSTKKFDDWGWIRGADGAIACVARGGDDKEFDEHRRDGTDPYAANAAFIVKACNEYDLIMAALDAAIGLINGHNSTFPPDPGVMEGLEKNFSEALERFRLVHVGVSGPGSDANG